MRLLVALRKPRTIAAIATTGLMLVFGVWEFLYPGPGEPKSPRYVLWKLGLPVEDLDDAVETMVGDTYPVRLVRGRTREQLVSRFGYITPLASASPYLQDCYVTYSSYPGSLSSRDVVFLRRGPWMVTMVNNRAADLILCKGQ